MLYISGYQLYSRWVPLMGQSKIAGKWQLITPLTYRRELTAQNVGLRIKYWVFSRLLLKPAS